MSHKYVKFLSKIAYLEKERQSDKLIIKELERINWKRWNGKPVGLE